MTDERVPIERIMDLLDGDLTGEEAARLEATLDARGRRELAGQAKVKDALGELPGPMLSDDERGRLRTSVKAELRIEEDAGGDRSTARRRRPSWLVRVLPSAAAAATVVAVIAVAVNLVGNGDTRPDPAPTDIESAVAEPVATVAPVTTASSRTLDTAGGAPDGESTAGEAPPDEAPADHAEAAQAAELAGDSAEALAEAALAEADMASAAAEAAIEDTPAELSDQADRVAFELATGRPEEARRIVGELAEMSKTAPVPAAELADRAVAAELVCWEGPLESAGEEGVILWMARGLIDGAEGEGYLVLPDSGDQSGTEIVALYVYPDCRELVLP